LRKSSQSIEISINELAENVIIYRYIDGDFVFVNLNDKAKITESFSESVIGRTITEVFDDKLDTGLLEKLFHVFTFGETQQLELKEYKNDSISFWRIYTIKKLANNDLALFYKDKNRELANKLHQIKEQNKHFKNALVKLAQIESKTLVKTLKKILKITNKALFCSRSSIWIYHKENQMLECIGLYTRKKKLFRNDRKIQIDIPKACIKRLESKEPILLDSTDKKNKICEAFQKYMKISKSASFLITPLLTNGKVVGILVNASKREATQWHKSEIDFSIAVGNHISLNLEIQKRKESEEKFNNISEVTLIGVFIYKNNFVYANKAFEKMTGYSFEELKKISPWKLFEKDMQKSLKKMIAKRLQGEKYFKEYSEIKVIKKGGETRLMRIAVETIMHEGDFAGAGSIVDITEIVKQKEKVSLLAKALEKTDNLVLITDVNGIISYVNDSWVRLSGFTKEELLGEKPNIFSAHSKDEASYTKMWDSILSGENYHDVIMDKNKNGEPYYVDFNITPIFGKEERVEHFVFTGADVSSRIRIENKLKQLATIDTLTKVYNRYKINEIIDHQIARSKRYDEVFSLLMFDIDYFKKVNDTYGHYVGDLVLKKLSELIQRNIREVDSFGRWGGEEFMLLLHKASREEAVFIAEKLRKLVKNYNIDNLYKITISIGVTTFSKYDTKETLLEKADNALYKSKEDGRNRVSFQ